VTKTPDLIASVEVCELLGIDRATLSRWVAAGRIKPAIQGPGTTGSRFFRRKDVEALHAERQAS
jgi:predicted site-specific integrase-resolvase